MEDEIKAAPAPPRAATNASAVKAKGVYENRSPVSRQEFEALKTQYAEFILEHTQRVAEFNRKSGIKF